MVVHSFNTNTQKAKAGISLCDEFKAILDYKARKATQKDPVSKPTPTKKKEKKEIFQIYFMCMNFLSACMRVYSTCLKLLGSHNLGIHTFFFLTNKQQTLFIPSWSGTFYVRQVALNT